MADASYLPVELISHIMQFLRVSDRKETSLVCRRWYNASLDPFLQRDIIVKYRPPRSDSVPPTDLIQRRLTNLCLSDWDTGALSEDRLVALLCRCPNLRVLDLSRCNSLFLSGKFLEQSADRAALRDGLGALQELKLGCLRHISDVTFSRLVSVTPCLESLSLASTNMIFGTLYDVNGSSPAMFHFSTFVRYLTEHATRIKAIDLSFTSINDKALGHLAQVKGLLLNSLRLQGCMELSDKGIKGLVAHQRNLQVLNISGSKELGTSKAFFRMFTSLPNLQTLSLRKCAQAGQCDVYNLSQIPSLKTLDMGEVLNLYDDDLIRGLCHEKAGNLRSLSLPFCPDLKDMFVVNLCQTNRSLTHLDLSSCVKLTDMSLHAITRHLLSLQSLRLAYCREISDLGILGYMPENGIGSCHNFDHDHVGCPCNRERESKIFRKPTGLTEQHSKSLSKVQFKMENGEELQMLSNLASLQVLDLSFCTRVTDLSLSIAVQFRELKSLSLSNLIKFNDTSVTAIARRNPSLEEVHLRNCVNLTDTSVMSLLRHCPRLSVLDVSQCDNLTSALLETLVKHGERLRHLDISFCGGFDPEICDFLETKLPNLRVSFRPYIY